MTELPDALRLEQRLSLPQDLKFLLEKYPRDTWNEQSSLGQTAQIWLQRHDMFRELGASLNATVHDYREGKMPPLDFARWFVPRLRFYMMQLNSHHQVEDIHYFPLFMAAERKLERGFEILDNDHHMIHDALERNRETAQNFLQALQENSDRQLFAADAYSNENERLLKMLTRHLDDEEDIIMPLIIDRGEEDLGLA